MGKRNERELVFIGGLEKLTRIEPDGRQLVEGYTLRSDPSKERGKGRERVTKTIKSRMIRNVHLKQSVNQHTAIQALPESKMSPKGQREDPTLLYSQTHPVSHHSPRHPITSATEPRNMKHLQKRLRARVSADYGFIQRSSCTLGCASG